VADFPIGHYSKKQIVKAGKALKKPLIWTDETREQVLETFRIAYDWRNSHALPLRLIRFELGGRARRVQNSGTITAGRIKRMPSIRKKLTRTTNTLIQMQDLGGCRTILESNSRVAALVQLYRDGCSAHEMREDTDYIGSPKSGGYRSHHFVLSFKGDGEHAIYNDRRIEIQIRTQLQHAWATAVEAVGLVRSEDLKAGEGDQDWLRLFELMSSEFADLEGCPLVPGTPQRRSARHAEIKYINNKVKATRFLESLNQAFKHSENYMGRNSDYFLIQYNSENQTVKVRSYANALGGAERYTKEESEHVGLTTVLVEIDKVENLRAAYPNYFLDVGTFTANINAVVKGRKTGLFQDATNVARGYDLSWLKQWR
jgi:hypothetical protein